jgi:hypothetical protein
MNDKKLAILGIVAVLMVGAAILQNRLERGDKTAGYGSSPLIEGLDVDAIDTIRVTSDQGSRTVTLNRAGGRFVVRDKGNYPADAPTINRLLNQCLDVRTVEKITSNPVNHADLKVTEDTAQYVIDFLNSDAEPIVTLLFSPADPETNAAYGRLLSRNEVYSLQRAPWINTRPIEYVNTSLVNVTPDKVSSVAVKIGEESYILSSPEGSDVVTLDKMPAGKQYKDTDYQSVFGALRFLRFEDVMQTANAPEGLDFNTTYNCKLYDLTVYKLSIARQDDATYVTVSADFLDRTPVEKTVGEMESDEELKKKEAKLLAIDHVKEFNAAHKNWIYRIPSNQAENLTKPLSALIEDAPDPVTPDDPAAPNGMEIPEGEIEE